MTKVLAFDNLKIDMKTRKITRDPRLVKVRNQIIKQMRKQNKIQVSLERPLFFEEIGEIFKLTRARVDQIIREGTLK